MSGLLERIVRRRRASASSRLGPQSENGAPYPSGVPNADRDPPGRPTSWVNGSPSPDAPAQEPDTVDGLSRAERSDGDAPAGTLGQDEFAEVYFPDPEATQEFGELAVEQMQAPSEPVVVPEPEREPAANELPPLEPAAIVPEPPSAAPVAAAAQPLAPAPAQPESEAETETEPESQPGLGLRGRIRRRVSSMRRLHGPESEPEPESESASASEPDPEAVSDPESLLVPEPDPPDPRPEPEAVAEPEAGAETPARTADPEPGFRERGRVRRRARYLRRLREVQLRDIGGLVLELHRFGRERPDLIQAKVIGAAQTDLELRGLERALGEQQPFRELREAAIGGACDHCGAVHGSTDRFCAACGEPLLYGDSLDGPAPEPEGLGG